MVDTDPMDLSAPEPADADQGWVFVIHDQQLCVDTAQLPEPGIPRLPAFLLRGHPDYRFLGLLHGEPCWVPEGGGSVGSRWSSVESTHLEQV